MVQHLSKSEEVDHIGTKILLCPLSPFGIVAWTSYLYTVSAPCQPILYGPPSTITGSAISTGQGRVGTSPENFGGASTVPRQ